MALLPPDPIFTMHGEMAPVHCLLYYISSCGEQLCAGTQSGHIHIWNLKTNREDRVISTGLLPVLSLHHVGDGNSDCFVTQEKGGNAVVWLDDGKIWTKLRIITMNYIGFCKARIHDHCGGVDLVSPQKDSAVSIVNYETGEIKRRLRSNMNRKLGEVMALKCIGGIVLVAYEIGIVVLWDFETGCVLSELNLSSDCPMTMDLHNDSMIGIVGTSGDVLFEIGIKCRALLRMRHVSITNPGVGAVSIRPDGKLFAAGCWDGRLRLFSCKTLRLLVVLDHHKEALQDVLFLSLAVTLRSCCWLLAATGKDARISLWDLYNDKR